ncbi:hypothetical protein IW261DRAFT_1426909 [Armillaria novae-zelandiae]|uniref:Uncharacterized protein n=1 Tax=Armillaria novae-zelandiae TaxID=153914 RepID=A0AA39NIZ8_9AGAR|nr:hypothetical protein IW261DRAFT_1426909 [Armillaria novae-zelandiae]
MAIEDYTPEETALALELLSNNRQGTDFQTLQAMDVDQVHMRMYMQLDLSESTRRSRVMVCVIAGITNSIGTGCHVGVRNSVLRAFTLTLSEMQCVSILKGSKVLQFFFYSATSYVALYDFCTTQAIIFKTAREDRKSQTSRVFLSSVPQHCPHGAGEVAIKKIEFMKSSRHGAITCMPVIAIKDYDILSALTFKYGPTFSEEEAVVIIALAASDAADECSIPSH